MRSASGQKVKVYATLHIELYESSFVTVRETRSPKIPTLRAAAIPPAGFSTTRTGWLRS